MSHPPLHRADAALAAGRVLAWALLICGWLALAALGRHWLPLQAGGLLLPALWLLGTAVALTGLGRWRLTRRGQTLALVLAGAVSAATAWAAASTDAHPVGLAAPIALTALPHWAAASLLALAWSALLALAATTVHGLRQARAEAGAQAGGAAGHRPAPPPLAAAGGTLLAAALLADAAGADPAVTLARITWALPLAGVALALLAALAGRAATPCRSGLFDCAWPVLRLAALRDPAQWASQAAAFAMLPMMAALPWMAAWCSTGNGTPAEQAASTAAQHLAAMLLPALPWPGLRPLPAARLRLAVAALLLLGGLALAWPGREGLAGAALLHGLAWGLAWRLRLAGDAGTAPSKAPSAARTLALSALALLGFGWALEAFGPHTLVALHGALALAGAAALWTRTAQEKGGPQAALHRWRTPSSGVR